MNNNIDYEHVLTASLSELSAKFKHPSRDVLRLNDIFIYPDLQIFEKSKKITTKYRADTILTNSKYACIAGAEDSGKSTLKQKLALDLRSAGYYPVLVNMNELKTTKPEDIAKNYYKKHNIESFFEIHRESNNFFLLIDDFSEDNLSSSKADRFFTNIGQFYKGIYIFGHESSFFGTIFNSFLRDFTHYTIQQFGYVLRNQLFEKWYRLGNENNIDDNEAEVLKKIDAVSKHFNIIQDRKLVENKPLYILMVLQTLENVEVKDYTKTSHGHCYNSLLISSLHKVTKNMPKIEGIIAFLSYFAYEMFSSQIMEIEKDHFHKIYQHYCTQFVEISDMKDILIESGVLVNNDRNQYVFSQKYIYFYCCGKYISDNIEDKKMKEVVSDLCFNIHNQNKATILIFVTHHLGPFRVKGVLQEILTFSELFLENTSEYKMDGSSLILLNDLGKTLPKIALEQKDIYLERSKKLSLQDELESKNIDSRNPIEVISYENEIDHDLLNFNDVTSAMKTIDVLGQIAKNGYSSIDKETLGLILQRTCTLGMKSLSFYLNLILDDAIGLKDFLTEKIIEMNAENPAKNEANAAINAEKYANIAATEAKNLIEKLCYLILFGLINYTAVATAHDLLDEIQEKVLDKNPNTAKKLIYLASKISTSGSNLPKDVITKTFNDLKDQSIPLHLMKHIILNHIYLNKIPVRDQQWLSTILKIPMAEQIAVSGTNRTNNFLDRMKKPISQNG